MKGSFYGPKFKWILLNASSNSGSILPQGDSLLKHGFEEGVNQIDIFSCNKTLVEKYSIQHFTERYPLDNWYVGSLASPP